jgi:hypothetical protein
MTSNLDGYRKELAKRKILSPGKWRHRPPPRREDG